jgi:hypothetical protein
LLKQSLILYADLYTDLYADSWTDTVETGRCHAMERKLTQTSHFPSPLQSLFSRGRSTDVTICGRALIPSGWNNPKGVSGLVIVSLVTHRRRRRPKIDPHVLIIFMQK